MGQTLSEPITEKTTHEGKNKNLMYGLSCMQGWRLSKFFITHIFRLFYTYIF